MHGDKVLSTPYPFSSGSVTFILESSAPNLTPKAFVTNVNASWIYSNSLLGLRCDRLCYLLSCVTKNLILSSYFFNMYANKKNEFL